MIELFNNRCGQGLRSILIIFLLLSVLEPLSAQRNTDYILKNTNVEALRIMATQFDREYRELIQIAQEKGWPTSNLYGIDSNGNPRYVIPDNSIASAMTKTTQLRSEFGVKGSGMLIGMWEANDNVIINVDTFRVWSPRVSHIELKWRISQQDIETNSGGYFASHATHVAGTLIGNGIGNAGALGMAPEASMNSYSTDNDFTEMANAAADLMLISNHSYGLRSGWDPTGSSCSGFNTRYTWYGGVNQFIPNGEDSNFGKYDSRSADIDQMLDTAIFYLPVKSSGNNHNDQPVDDFFCSSDVRYYTGNFDDNDNPIFSNWISYDEDNYPSGDGTHTSSIASWANAKNVLTVGNLQDDEVINEGSSRGMTDDGRIKPDICGNGTTLTSTESESDISWGSKTGTSMAAPNVAGSLLLLQELYEQKNGNNGTYMRSATLKGLAIHTATDLGNPGPDFTYGWGLLNARKAAAVINRASYDLDHRIIEVNNPNNYSFTFFKDGPLKVTLCYTDKAGTATSVHNDPTPKLVNDLDLTLVQTNGATHYPYVLNTANPSAYATTGNNNLDNIEQIDLNNATDGEYTVYVNVEGTLTGSQSFSLIISGVSDGCGGGDNDLGNNVIDSGVYYGFNILSEGDVNSGSVVKFVAAENVLLHLGGNSSGFHAKEGSNFKAVALPCE